MCMCVQVCIYDNSMAGCVWNHVWYVLNFTIIIGGSFDNGKREHLIGTYRLEIIVTITCVDRALFLSVDSSEPATANGEPAVTVQETKIDQPSGDGVAVIGERGLLENSSKIKLLREESRESQGAVESQPLAMDHGVLNPISEEVENYPDAAAPYLVSHCLYERVKFL